MIIEKLISLQIHIRETEVYSKIIINPFICWEASEIFSTFIVFSFLGDFKYQWFYSISSAVTQFVKTALRVSAKCSRNRLNSNYTCINRSTNPVLKGMFRKNSNSRVARLPNSPGDSARRVPPWLNVQLDNSLHSRHPKLYSQCSAAV